MRCGADYGSIFSSSSSGCCNESVRRLRLALRCIGSFQFTPRVPAPARKVQLAPRQTRWRRRECVADPAESAMCRLGKIVLGFAALILPSLKCSRRSRNQSAKSAKRRELREGSQVARPGPVQHEGNRQQQSRWSVAWKGLWVLLFGTFWQFDNWILVV